MKFSLNSIPNTLNSGKTFPLHAKGDVVNVNTSNSRHYDNTIEPTPSDNAVSSFAQVFQKAIEEVNDQQVHAEKLTEKLAFDPESVNAHEVMIASEKARLSLTFTKTVTDGIVRAYKEISNLR